jgi:hypothetical protein
MDCEEALVTQAEATHSLQKPGGHVWVYRNSVKALPWFTSVREKLEDRAHWGWFLPFKNCTDGRGGYFCGPNATQNLYHDFEQAGQGVTSLFQAGANQCIISLLSCAIADPKRRLWRRR